MSVVIVSGANRGLGLGIAREFARRGHQVHAGVRRPAEAGHLGDGVRVGALDVCSTVSVENFVADVVADSGAIDVVVCNAGVFGVSPIELADDASIIEMFEVNTFGVLRLIRSVLPVMRDQGRGSIIAIGSLSGRVPAPGTGVYAASKLAVVGLIEALAFEVEQFGIRVTCVEPGPYPTQMGVPQTRPGPDHSPYGPLMRQLAARAAARMAQAGDPDEVAHAVVAAAFDEDVPLHLPVGRHALAALGTTSHQPAVKWLAALRSELVGVAGQ